MSKTKLGYIQLPAGKVVDLSEAALARIAENKTKHAEEFITNMMAPKKGWFFGHPARSRDAAIAAIKADQYLSEEWWYTTKYVGPKEEALDKLRKVALAMLVSEETPTMEVSIEAATWLFPSQTNKVEESS